jgi:hypothetical protein
MMEPDMDPLERMDAPKGGSTETAGDLKVFARPRRLLEKSELEIVAGETEATWMADEGP